MLFLDLAVFHKRDHEIEFKEAALWTLFWISLALGFNLLVYFFIGEKQGIEFLAAYFMEESLSIDNMFVFVLIFTYFKVPKLYYHRVLFWGILGALVFRAIFIFAGVALINKFHWLLYVFGAFLVITGIKMLFQKDEEIHPEHNPVLKLVKKIFPVTPDYVKGNFFTRIEGVLYATPMFVVLAFIETSDIIFAVDSIPAVLSISRDPLIVYTSNVFAILGLRSLFFVISGVMKFFRFLNYGVSLILVFVGAKMLLENIYKIPTGYSFLVILTIVILSILASIFIPEKDKEV
jgi:tellurite resistance protein TerC